MALKLLLSIFFSLITLSVLAGPAIDSVGVENLNGKKTILHKVDPKDTYYSIGRKYHVSPKILMDHNSTRGLKPGDIVKVPTNVNYVQEVKVAATTTKSPSEIIEYKVGPRETLYSISKRFSTTIEDIKSLNNLSRNSLAVGQLLKIRVGKPSETSAPARPPVQVPPITKKADSNEIDTIVDASARLKLPAYRYGLREVVERGVASSMVDESLDNTKMLALHATAPVGTIVKITNPMTSKTTFAKVVGKFTESEATKDVIIVVNKATADIIGALDKRFQVTLVYGVPNE